MTLRIWIALAAATPVAYFLLAYIGQIFISVAGFLLIFGSVSTALAYWFKKEASCTLRFRQSSSSCESE